MVGQKIRNLNHKNNLIKYSNWNEETDKTDMGLDLKMVKEQV